MPLNFSKNTGELFVELKEEKNLKNYLNRNQEEFVKPLHEYLQDLLKQKHLIKQEVVEKSKLDRTYAYHIFSGNRKNPSRPKLLALSIAMNLNLEETQYLLRYANQGLLYPRNQWDSVIISAINQKLDVIQTNELLHQLGEKLLLD